MVFRVSLVYGKKPVQESTFPFLIRAGIKIWDYAHTILQAQIDINPHSVVKNAGHDISTRIFDIFMRWTQR